MTRTLPTLEERRHREADERAQHELRLEGLNTPPEFEPLFERFATGELSSEAVRAELDRVFKRS